MPRTADDSPPKALAIFDIQQGPLAISKVGVPAPVVSIGQSVQNDVVLADDSVSRRHARLEYEDGAWHVTDLDSTNGTYLNGTRLAPNTATELPYGANIRFGAVLSRFRPTETDLDAERARYTPPPALRPLAERGAARFRFPLWAFLLLLLVVAVLVYSLALAQPVTISS